MKSVVWWFCCDYEAERTKYQSSPLFCFVEQPQVQVHSKKCLGFSAIIPSPPHPNLKHDTIVDSRYPNQPQRNETEQNGKEMKWNTLKVV